MRKIILTAFALFSASLTFAAPDPRDSVIVESKTVPQQFGPCQSGVLKVRIWITNKDTIHVVKLPFEAKSIAGTAYGTLSRSTNCSSIRTFNDVFDFLLPSNQLPNRAAEIGGYNSISPDQFRTTLNFDPDDTLSKVPPNLSRVPLIDIKFDSVSGAGRFQLDSMFLPFGNDLQFGASDGSKIKANFLKGIITPVGPHPADSIIVESKVVFPAFGPCQSAGMKVRVWVTNKDSLANISLYLETKSRSGGAYATLSRPATCGNRAFSSVIEMLFPSTQYLKGRLANIQNYHSNPPDTFAAFFTLSDPTDDTEKFPPHLTRTPIVDIKFDTVWANIGEFEIDSGRVLSGTIQMVNLAGGKVAVNFAKSIISVTCNTPPGTPTLNCPASSLNFTRGDPFSFDFNSNAFKPAFSITQGPGNIDALTGLYTLGSFCSPGAYPVTIRVIGSIGSTCVSPPVFCNFTLNVFDNPPSFTNCPDSIFSTSPGVSFSLQLAATDPDVVDTNSLTFSLATGPPGLTVSPTGLVQWTPTPEQSGAFYACVSVTDPCGASSKCCLNFNGRKGDLNLDGILNSQDVVLMLNCVFLGIDPPAGQPGCDVNCTGAATPLDVIYQINAIFSFWSYPCP